MAQNQPSSAIPVVNSDTINIPKPGIITSGTWFYQIFILLYFKAKRISKSTYQKALHTIDVKLNKTILDKK